MMPKMRAQEREEMSDAEMPATILGAASLGSNSAQPSRHRSASSSFLGSTCSAITLLPHLDERRVDGAEEVVLNRHRVALKEHEAGKVVVRQRARLRAELYERDAGQHLRARRFLLVEGEVARRVETVE